MMTSLLLLICGLAAAHAAYIPALSVRRPAAVLHRSAVVTCNEKPTDASGEPIKAAVSSYMHFCAERRPGLTQELKASMGATFKNPAVMTALGAEWKALGDSEKARFAAKATADKDRYDAAVASNPANANLKKKKRVKKESSGPRKLSAYMHFCAERRPSITVELKASMGASFKNPAVMTALGAEWKALGEAEKARFQAIAAQPVA